MPTSVGPNPALDSNIVFSYDTGDTSNSYKGEPTTNYQWNSGYEVTPSYSDWTGALPPIDVTNTSNQGPIKGAKTWQFTKNGSSNQWHGWEATYGGIWTGNAGDIWTTSYWYKTTTPAGISSFGIGYFYKPDWSAPFNTSILANVNSIIADGQWHYNYTTTQFNENYSNAIIVDGPSWGYSTNPGVLYINGLQWEKKNHPTQFAYGTRSATQGLLPLISNSTINLSTVSFNSNAQMIFDGTDDYITVPHDASQSFTGDFTIESVIYPTANTANCIIQKGPGSDFYQEYWLLQDMRGSSRYISLIMGKVGNSTANYIDTANISVLNTYHHIVATISGNLATIYVNGKQQATGTISNRIQSTSDIRIGQRADGFAATSGLIPIVKLYNTALSADQVKQNYQQYKSRFNLS